MTAVSLKRRRFHRMKFRRIFGSSTEYSSLGVTRQMDATLYPHSLVSAADDQETPTLAIMSGPDEDTPQIKGLRESFLDESTQKLVARLTEARRFESCIAGELTKTRPCNGAVRRELLELELAALERDRAAIEEKLNLPKSCPAAAEDSTYGGDDIPQRCNRRGFINAGIQASGANPLQVGKIEQQDRDGERRMNKDACFSNDAGSDTFSGEFVNTGGAASACPSLLPVAAMDHSGDICSGSSGIFEGGAESESGGNIRTICNTSSGVKKAPRSEHLSGRWPVPGDFVRQYRQSDEWGRRLTGRSQRGFVREGSRDANNRIPVTEDRSRFVPHKTHGDYELVPEFRPNERLPPTGYDNYDPFGRTQLETGIGEGNAVWAHGQQITGPPPHQNFESIPYTTDTDAVSARTKNGSAAAMPDPTYVRPGTQAVEKGSYHSRSCGTWRQPIPIAKGVNNASSSQEQIPKTSEDWVHQASGEFDGFTTGGIRQDTSENVRCKRRVSDGDIGRGNNGVHHRVHDESGFGAGPPISGISRASSWQGERFIKYGRGKRGWLFRAPSDATSKCFNLRPALSSCSERYPVSYPSPVPTPLCAARVAEKDTGCVGGEYDSTDRSSSNHRSADNVRYHANCGESFSQTPAEPFPKRRTFCLSENVSSNSSTYPNGTAMAAGADVHAGTASAANIESGTHHAWGAAPVAMAIDAFGERVERDNGQLPFDRQGREHYGWQSRTERSYTANAPYWTPCSGGSGWRRPPLEISYADSPPREGHSGRCERRTVATQPPLAYG